MNDSPSSSENSLERYIKDAEKLAEEKQLSDGAPNNSEAHIYASRARIYRLLENLMPEIEYKNGHLSAGKECQITSLLEQITGIIRIRNEHMPHYLIRLMIIWNSHSPDIKK